MLPSSFGVSSMSPQISAVVRNHIVWSPYWKQRQSQQLSAKLPQHCMEKHQYPGLSIYLSITFGAKAADSEFDRKEQGPFLH